MRFLIVLLLACLAMPALASPRCAPLPPAPMAYMHHGDHPSPSAPHSMPDSATARHDCIGCIPPIDGLARLAVPVRTVKPDTGAPRSDRAVARVKDCPATPPPKRLA